MSANRFKQPKKKFWRWCKYTWIQHLRDLRKQERAERLGLAICEVCGRTEEDGVSICSWCSRCDYPGCNAGCIECKPTNFGESIYREERVCSCCGQKIH